MKYYLLILSLICLSCNKDYNDSYKAKNLQYKVDQFENILRNIPRIEIGIHADSVEKPKNAFDVNEYFEILKKCKSR